MSVHVKGNLRFLDDEGLIDVLKRTSLYFENHDRASTTIYDNLAEDYTSKLMKAIVAFEIKVESMDHVFKLSQNRDQESYHSIIEKLENKDEQGKAIAAEMQKRAGHLFPSEGQ
jgi:transcriptional regulator